MACSLVSSALTRQSLRCCPLVRTALTRQSLCSRQLARTALTRQSFRSRSHGFNPTKPSLSSARSHGFNPTKPSLSSARLCPDKAFTPVRYVRTARGPSKALAFPRPRRSCKVQRSPRNDSQLRTVLPLQHLTHVRPVVRVNNPIDTPLVNHNIPSQPGISIYQPRSTI